MIYKKGTLFMVCTHEELLEKGWEKEGGLSGTRRYEHDDFSECLISYLMIEDNQNKMLSVLKETTFPKWYFVKENTWKWPVATFLITDTDTDTNDHECIEGMTPIDGWFICKHCGTNLKEIK